MVPATLLRRASWIPLVVLGALPSAHAQNPARSVPNAAGIREEILGYDPASDTLGYVERSASALSGFSHVTIVQVSRDGSTRRIRLTTDIDVDQWRSAPNRSAIDARVAGDLASNRTRFHAGESLPVTSSDGTSSACTRAPFPVRHFRVGDGVVAEVSPSSDSTASQLVFSAGGRSAAGQQIPGAMVTQNQNTTRAPYDVIADVRQFAGIDLVGVLLRADACTPEGTPVPARALFVAALPVPEQPLQQLAHAELQEHSVIAAVAPRAHRRTVDETSSYYDGTTRVMFDTAWHLPGSDHMLAQYARASSDMPPPLVDNGEAPALFAVVEEQGSRVRVIQQLIPPTRENVFEGAGQEAYQVDLDGDGRPEVFVRAQMRPHGEFGTLLRWGTDDGLGFIWRVQLSSDERGSTPGPAEVRRCTVGVDGRVLVVRCNVDRYAAGAPAGAQPESSTRSVQRVRWNGGVLEVR